MAARITTWLIASDGEYVILYALCLFTAPSPTRLENRTLQSFRSCLHSEGDHTDGVCFFYLKNAKATRARESRVFTRPGLFVRCMAAADAMLRAAQDERKYSNRRPADRRRNDGLAAGGTSREKAGRARPPYLTVNGNLLT